MAVLDAVVEGKPAATSLGMPAANEPSPNNHNLISKPPKQTSRKTIYRQLRAMFGHREYIQSIPKAAVTPALQSQYLATSCDAPLNLFPHCLLSCNGSPSLTNDGDLRNATNRRRLLRLVAKCIKTRPKSTVCVLVA